MNYLKAPKLSHSITMLISSKRLCKHVSIEEFFTIPILQYSSILTWMTKRPSLWQWWCQSLGAIAAKVHVANTIRNHETCTSTLTATHWYAIRKRVTHYACMWNAWDHNSSVHVQLCILLSQHKWCLLTQQICWRKGGKAGLINLYPISVHNIMRNTINSNTGVQLPVIFGTHQA